MFISANILLTRLQFSNPEIVISSKSAIPLAPLKGIKQLPQKPGQTTPDNLYLCDASHPFLSGAIPDSLMLVCVTASYSLTPWDDFVIFVQTSAEMADILNRLLDLYQELRDWEQQLDLALMGGCSLTRLLDISGPVLGYPLVIYDASLKVLAHSSALHFQDPLFQSVVEKGYLPPQLVFRFERDNIFTELEQRGIVYGKYLSARGYSDILISLKKGSYTAAYMAMPLVPATCEQYGGELLSMLGKKVDYFLEKEQESSLAKRYMHEYLLAELLENETASIESLKERLEYIQLPFHGFFYLLKLMPTSKFKVSTEHLMRYLESLLVDALCFNLQNDMYILFHYAGDISGEEAAKRFSASLKSIQPDLQHEAVICGVSLPFYALTEIRSARQQADAAILLTQKQRLPLPSEPFCYYESCRIFHLFQLAQEKADLKAFCHPGLLAMYEKSLRDDGTHFLVLKTYFACNGSISDTAQRLHMHRNNVVYHLKRMENLYHFDLSDHKDHFHLELTLQLLDYLDGGPGITMPFP